LASNASEDFTNEERQQLKLAIATFRLRLIETFNPTEEQLHVVLAKIDYLISAVDRLNRFDWKGVALYFDRNFNHSNAGYRAGSPTLRTFSPGTFESVVPDPLT
jgi:hypothetical protein